MKPTIPQTPIDAFLGSLTEAERALMRTLDTPFKIQSFLDETLYPGGEENRTPAEVLRQKKAHCLDGGLFACSALRLIGFEPQIVDMQPEPGQDDDHVLALYRLCGGWGAIAKSNFSGLRFREPIHRSIRELVLSYFDDSFNMRGEKTLRYYTRPVKLARFDSLNWMTDARGIDAVEAYLKKAPLTRLISPEQAACLSPTDRRSFEAGTLGLNQDGVFKLDAD